ncbi:MAG TPA: hypothetical protein VM754_08565 [Actinomycetota bacterium]|jgi:hypothetical protein|nr:hypothetical protein [Actinomycetota bacterium]
MNEFWSRFKWYMIGGGVLLFVGAIVLTIVLVRNSEGPIMAAPPPAPGENGEVPRIETVPAQEFRGEGSKEQSIQAGGGLTIITLTHEGGQNFVVQFGQGENMQLLVNEIGNYRGSKAVGLPVGTYTLKIATRGRWTARVDQSVPTEAPSAPKKLEGDGAEASDFFFLSAGTARFKLSFEGDGLFAPYLLKASDGSVVTVLANEFGRFTGDKAVEIAEDGIYLVDVTGSGRWSIDVAQ